ncbi:MAG: hypothetical protein EXS67_03690 [Candidatus Margulisbacteria bacterium]|nr:hypothetical protein [Candidatus Margulisiibacteriota bacterium]
MLYKIILELLQKHLYIVHSERYANEQGRGKIERIIAKHPLLKPKLIIVNDELHGFKKIQDKVKSLEEFPIFLELDYDLDEEGQNYLNSLDLYSETTLKMGSYLRDVMQLSQLYNHTVYLERVKRLDDPTEESLIIYSRLNELVFDESIEEDLEEGFMTENEARVLVEEKISGFIAFLKLLDALLVKGIRVSQMGQLFKASSDL